jgi:hypothetical protein
MEKLIAFFTLIGLLVVLALVLAFPIMWLWNGCLVPAMPGTLAPITFLQALGIKVLVGLISYSSSNNSKD